jgi:hypothetical protein
VEKKKVKEDEIQGKIQKTQQPLDKQQAAEIKKASIQEEKEKEKELKL